MIGKIDKTFRTLARNPSVGCNRDEIGPDVRTFPVGRYLIMHKIIAGGIEIVRVVHGRRNLDALD